MSCIASAVSSVSTSGSTCRKVRPAASTVETPSVVSEPVGRVVGAEREDVGVGEVSHRPLTLGGDHRRPEVRRMAV